MCIVSGISRKNNSPSIGLKFCAYIPHAENRLYLHYLISYNFSEKEGLKTDSIHCLPGIFDSESMAELYIRRTHKWNLDICAELKQKILLFRDYVSCHLLKSSLSRPTCVYYHFFPYLSGEQMIDFQGSPLPGSGVFHHHITEAKNNSPSVISWWWYKTGRSGWYIRWIYCHLRALTGWSNASMGTSCSSVKGNVNPCIWGGMIPPALVHGGGWLAGNQICREEPGVPGRQAEHTPACYHCSRESLH